MNVFSNHPSCGDSVTCANRPFPSVILRPHNEVRGVCVWKGFKVLACLCRAHNNNASHDLVSPSRDAHRFATDALVGRRTVESLCVKRDR